MKGSRGAAGDDRLPLHTTASYGLLSVENSSLYHAVAGSLAEVMESSISMARLFVSGWVIPMGCYGAGYAPNPLEMWKQASKLPRVFATLSGSTHAA